ncbi:MAG: N-acetylglucosamine-6-phosphate deacetylase [Halanaerobiales bacterium]|nr:N-acetylglucosamine-6-phosphate deacetylase [Halanaerobiales bacterium]
MKLIKNVNIITPTKIIKNASVLFDKKIKKIFKTNDFNENDYEVIDGNGGYLSPGFIDIHVHGAMGKDTMDASYEALDTISDTIIKSGVTSFLPTTMTMERKKVRNALKNIKETIDRGLKGAQIIGTNVEGPFLNTEKKGAQDPKNIIEPDLKLLDGYESIIKLITIAPEKKGAKEFIKEMRKHGIKVSVGHSTASYEETIDAYNCGLSHVTHLFNGMIELHHRRPGIIGAALTNDMTVELIADLIHLNPVILDMVSKIKDSDKIILVTDSMRANGLEDGTYSLGGQKVILKDGEARIETGSLAGSTLTLDKAVKNMYNSTDLDLHTVFKMVTINPARLLGVDHYKGLIKENYDADLTLLNKNLEVKQVYIKGEQKF